MPSSFNDKWVKCPFYGRDDNNGIICEGIQPGTALRLMFNKQRGGNDPASKMEHMKRYCMEEYYFCPLCKMLEEKYE